VKELKSIFGLLILVIGSLLLYKTLPVYWANFKVDRMISEQAIYYTTYPKSDKAITEEIAEKAQELNVPLTPEQVTVTHGAGTLSISIVYTVHVEFPIHPLDMNFKNSTTNTNIMK
jgi:hypothetical protein